METGSEGEEGGREVAKEREEGVKWMNAKEKQETKEHKESGNLMITFRR